MPRRLMLTVDVEAQSHRASDDHVNRLIWGEFPDGRAGIGEMMDIADKHGAKMTMFLDWAESDKHGDAIRDAGREIHRRGHDLQLHVHTDYFSEEFWNRKGVKYDIDLNILSPEQADVIADEITARQLEATGSAPVAFRGGGYRYSANLLNALRRNGVLLDTSVNVSRPTQPVDLSLSSQFRWSNGMIEVPVSNVAKYRNCPRPLDFNFNSGYFHDAGRMHEYLDNFWNERGDEAIAVLVMHSWSLLKLPEDGLFRYDGGLNSNRFAEFLSGLQGKVEFVTSADLVALDQAGRLPLDPDVDLDAFAEAQQRRAQSKNEPSIGYTAQSSTLAKAGYTSLSCPICGAAKARFVQLNGRKCPDCGSVERQRCFAIAYQKGIKERFDVSGKEVLIFSPSVSELRFLNDEGLAAKQSADIRPDVKPDLLLDMCDMPSVEANSKEFVFASYLMPVVHDMNAALDEIERILAPGGVFISIEPVQAGRPTREIADRESQASWYGQEALEKYKVGSHRTLGEEDYQVELERYFTVERFTARDPITGQINHAHLCWSKKPAEIVQKGQRISKGVALFKALLGGGQEMAQTTSVSKDDIYASAEALWADLDNSESQKKSVALFHRLYELGDRVRAGYRLGAAYYQGRGVPRNLDKAYEFLSIPELDTTRFAVYFRGLVLKDPKFSDRDELAALNALQQAHEMGVEVAAGHISEVIGSLNCPICKTAASAAISENGICPGCGSDARQRIFMTAYQRNLHYSYDLSGKNGLLVGAAIAEQSLFLKIGVGSLTTLDINPETRPDNVGDICSQTSFADDTFDFIFASHVLTCAHDLEAALGELFRVLKPGGALFTIDPVVHTGETEEVDDIAAVTSQFGTEVYERYKIGSYRRFGRQGLIDTLTSQFQTQIIDADDPLTRSGMSVFISKKISGDFTTTSDARRLEYINRIVEENKVNEINANCDFSKKYMTYKEEHPGTSYASFAVNLEAHAVSRGTAAHATLGLNVTNRSRKQGDATYELYCGVLQVRSDQRVIEYGCGSLRVGAGFISYLGAGQFFGLDVVPTFYELGCARYGQDEIESKGVQFHVIDEEGITQAASFGADHVYACAVIFHIHPDDILDGTSNLVRLASKPGAKLIFDAKVTRDANPCRYSQKDGKGGWAWPLEFYQAALAPLELVAVHRRGEYGWAPEVDIADLEFRMPFGRKL